MFCRHGLIFKLKEDTVNGKRAGDNRDHNKQNRFSKWGFQVMVQAEDTELR